MHDHIRDFLSIGSWVFYALVLGRSLIEPYWDFALPVLAAIIPLGLAQRYWDHDGYSARGLVLVFFTTRFYADITFGAFAATAYLALLYAALQQTTRQAVGRGLLVGVVSVGIGLTLTLG